MSRRATLAVVLTVVLVTSTLSIGTVGGISQPAGSSGSVSEHSGVAASDLGPVDTDGQADSDAGGSTSPSSSSHSSEGPNDGGDSGSSSGPSSHSSRPSSSALDSDSPKVTYDVKNHNEDDQSARSEVVENHDETNTSTSSASHSTSEADETETENGSNTAKTGAPEFNETYYQVDFVQSEPIEHLGGANGTYTPDELIRFAHGDDQNGITRRSDGEFLQDENLSARLDTQNITVEDCTASTAFRVTEGEPVTLSLVSYTKTGPGWSREREHLQKFVDSETRTLGPGTYTFTVNLPGVNCSSGGSESPLTTTSEQPSPSGPETETETESETSTSEQPPTTSTPTTEQPSTTTTSTPEQPTPTTPGTQTTTPEQAGSDPPTNPEEPTTTSGQATNTPGQATNTPGQATNTPGQATTTPAETSTTTEQSTSTPEQPTTTPGQSTTTPEQPPTTSTTPGETTTPGQPPTTPEQPTTTPEGPPTTTTTPEQPPEQSEKADLAVTKTVNDTNATIGDNVTFTVNVTNNGPDTATNVSVGEMLESGLTFQNASVTQGEYNAESSLYDVGTLENGKTATLTLVATIESADNTTNAVEVTSETPDPNEPNNNDSANPNPRVADLSLTKNVNESAPNVGDNVEYTLDLTNNGPNATSNVSVADALPDRLTFVSADAGQGSYDEESGLWSVGSLASGDEQTLTVVATVESAENVTNVAEVDSSDVFDPDSTPGNDNPNEDDQDNVTINGQQADVSVTKTVEDTNATVGDDVTFTVNVTNHGPDTATNVSVYETPEGGLSFQSAETTQGEYNPETNVYDVGTLTNDDTATLTITATIVSADNTTNAVTVTSNTPDPNQPNNNNTSDPNPQVADLSLTKSVNESTPNVGDNVAFTLDLMNDGPNATSNVSVEDALPDGLSYVSSDVSQGSYEADTGIWTVGDLDTGDDSTLTIVASVESAENVTNTAQVNTSDVFDPDSTPANSKSGEDDQDNATLNGQQADLALTKTVNTTENVTVGDTVEFTVGVTNNGPDTATNVTVNEYPGEGLSFESAEVTQGSYDNGTGVYDVGTLEDGESATLTIVSTITSPNDTANFVNATSDQPDETPPNNTTNPNPKVADLELTKEVNESAPNVGENVAFTIDLTNTGPNTTSNVSVEDTLPENVTFVDSTASQGSYDAETGLWSVGALDDGDSLTLTIVASVESAENVTNTAQVTSSELFDPDSTPANSESDEDDQDTAILNGQQADLALTKTVNTTENVTVGDTVEFTVGVTNNGPDTATNVTVNEYPGEGLSFESAAVTQGSYDSDTGVYDVGTLDNGESATLTIVSTITSPNDTANFVNATSDQPDETPPNNTTNPNPKVADLELTKSVNESAPNVGENVAFTIDLTNTGPNATSNVTVEDALPEGVTFVDSTASQGSYDDSSGTWSVGDLANGDESTLTLVASVESTENVTNTAQVNTSDVYDPDSTPGNNESSEDDQDNATLNGQQADLALTKTVNTTENVTVGDTVEFTVGVTNNGPDTATNVTVNEYPGEGLSFESAEVTQGSYDNGTGVYDVGTLEDGESATLTIVSTITSPNDTANFVNATSDQPDETPPNNTTDPNPKVADLELTKDVNATTPTVGDNVAFTIDLTNEGPNATADVSVEDVLPENVTFVSASASQGSYDNDTGSWTVGELANGDSSTLTIIASVESAGDITNVAQVTSSELFDPDSTPANDVSGEDDQDNATLTAQEQTVDLEVSKSVDDDLTGPGYNQTFTVNVTNNGPNTATNVVVEDRYDDLLSIVTSDTTQGSFDEASGEFSIASLAPGETATLTYTAQSTDTYGNRSTAEVMSVDQTDVDSTPGNNDPAEDDQDSVASGAQPIFRNAPAVIGAASAPFQPASQMLTFTDGTADGTEFDQDNIIMAGIDRGNDELRYSVDEDYTSTITSTSGDANSLTVNYNGVSLLQEGDEFMVLLKQYDRTDGAGEIFDRNQPPTAGTPTDQQLDGTAGGQITTSFQFPLNDKRSAILSDNSDYFTESDNPGIIVGDLGAAGSFELIGSNAGSSSATVSGASLPAASSPTSSTASQNTTTETPTTTTETSDHSSNTTTKTSTETATTETETETETETTTAELTTTETETATTTPPTETATETPEPTPTKNTTTAPTTEASPTTTETAESATATVSTTSASTTEAPTVSSDANETSPETGNTTAAP